MRRLKIILIGNLRKKAVFLLAAALFWTLMFLAASYFVHSNTGMNTSASDPAQYSTYESQEWGFAFSYPSTFTVTPQSFTGNEILHHVDFKDTAGPGYGFIQIWELATPLSDFLEKSKEASRLKYKYFTSKRIKVGSYKGFYWDYSFLAANNSYYKGNEVFLDVGGRMYRISYFMPENQWNEAQKDIFTGIVKSFRKY